jgi:DNA-binding transcriptional regulator/RsmH inhibitor MraZ
VDGKARIVMPRPLRDGLGDPFVLTRAPQKTLIAMPKRTWDRLLRRNGKAASWLGYYAGGAHVVTLEAVTYRFIVPYELRVWAGLKPGATVAVSGLVRAVQVATEATWREQLSKRESATCQLLLDLGL